MKKLVRKFIAVITSMVMSLLVLSVFSAAAETNTVSAASAKNTFNGHTYKVFNTSKTWKNAKKYCESLGGHLVTIGSEAEQNYVAGLIKYEEKIGYWIGLEKTSSGWKWVDGTKFSYTNWSDGQPDNWQGKEKYGAMYSATVNYSDWWSAYAGGWNDSDNGKDGDNSINGAGFICEWDKVKNISDDKNTDKTFTLMIYMCGADLESMYNLASADIDEIVKGCTGKKVNVIIQTGGSKKWHYPGISSKKVSAIKRKTER